MCARNSTIVSSWKLESSSTFQPSSRELSTIAVTGVPMLPPTCTGTPASRRMWPIRLVVVVLPFEPVIPMVRPLQKRRGQFHFADHRHAAPARRFERREIGRHVGREHDQVGALEDLRRSAARTGCRVRGRPGNSSSGFRSVARTSAPSRSEQRRRRQTGLLHPDHQRLYALELHLSFNVVSANSASTRPAIQKRAMIFDSVQPSASK